jgi:DNA-binding CsgD family transcriptional regulator
MHVLPRSAAAGGGVRLGMQGTELTAREARCSSCSRTAHQRRDRRALAIGIETVRTHARSIYRKLGVASRRELAALSQPGARRGGRRAPARTSG